MPAYADNTDSFEVWAAECGLDFKYFVYKMYSADDTLLYAGITNSVRNRMYQHYHSKPWIDQVVNIDYETVPDEAAARARETELITTQVPVYNVSQQEEVAAVVDYLKRVYEREGCDEVQASIEKLKAEKDEIRQNEARDEP